MCTVGLPLCDCGTLPAAGAGIRSFVGVVVESAIRDLSAIAQCAVRSLALEPKALALARAHFLWRVPYLERVPGEGGVRCAREQRVPRRPVGPPPAGPLRIIKFITY